MLFGDDWLSLEGVLDSMVDDLVVIYSLCLIADFCPLGEAVFCALTPGVCVERGPWDLV